MDSHPNNHFTVFAARIQKVNSAEGLRVQWGKARFT